MENNKICDHQIHPLATQGTDEDSATVEPQSHVGDRSTSPPRKERPQKQGPQNQKGKKTLAEKQPSELPKAKKQSPWIQTKTMKNLKNEPGTSSNSRPNVPVLSLPQGPAASSQGAAASNNVEDEHSEYSDGKSARSQDSERTLFYPDLYGLTNDDHWTMTPETHKYEAAAGSFCSV